MTFSADAYVKVIVGISLSLLCVASFFILAPNPKTHNAEVMMARDFGQFLEKNHAITNGHFSLPSAPGVVVLQPESAGVPILAPEEVSGLRVILKDWTVENYVRGELWRSQVESLMALAEKTHSTELLDDLKPQIIGGRYDNDQVNQIAAKVWAERFLKLEQREFQRNQIQDLLTK